VTGDRLDFDDVILSRRGDPENRHIASRQDRAVGFQDAAAVHAPRCGGMTSFLVVARDIEALAR